MRLEARPKQVYVAVYDQLPHPGLVPVQEFVFDLGITVERPTILTDVVWRVFDEHEHVAYVRQRLGREAMQALTLGQYGVTPGMGLIVPRCYFLDQGATRYKNVRVSVAGYDVETQTAVSAALDVPLQYHRQRATLHLPFVDGAWWAITGNDWSSMHKADPVSWPFAYDFVKLGPDGRTYAGDGQRNEDHVSFGQPVVAPAAGKIVLARDDMPDQPPGQPLHAEHLAGQVARLAGNTVVIGHGAGEFSFFGHLQAGSLQVQVGQMVKRGQLLARVGNSGHSPGPHLHYHLQDGPSLFVDRGLPVLFSSFIAVGDRVKQATIPSRMIVSPK
jgi:murein DD-endopeptidase MepM/ murein hydrolase activator NlpD